jgi:hypothetical protein
MESISILKKKLVELIIKMEGHSVVLYIHPLAKQCSGMQAAKVAAPCGRRAGRPTAGQQLYMGLVVFCKLKYIIIWISLFSDNNAPLFN